MNLFNKLLKNIYPDESESEFEIIDDLALAEQAAMLNSLRDQQARVGGQAETDQLGDSDPASDDQAAA